MKYDSLTLTNGSAKDLFLPQIQPGGPKGLLGLNRGGLSLTKSDGSLEEVTPNLGALFAFSRHTFTSGPVLRRDGPNLQECLTAYANQEFISSREFFNVSLGKQIFRVPASGRYRIEVLGASNGVGAARVTARFDLLKDETLTIVCGQQGIGRTVRCSGCGATAVISSRFVQPLMMAGGAGGYRVGHPGASPTFSLTASPRSASGGAAFHDSGRPSSGGGGSSAFAPGNIIVNTNFNSSLGGAVVSGNAYGSRSATPFSGNPHGGFGGGGYGASDSALTGVGGGGGYVGGSAQLGYGNHGTSFIHETAIDSEFSSPRPAASGGTVLLVLEELASSIGV